ncbi:hypothetical protein HK099_003399 [Clydaea vesicula]|uniref:Uncharacterized protein n=1 Tax=Clydaea vesicula TaxID=447962 RepID=A0AAD5U1Q2_9FUNG|nr:hypothetical protein HK099_003399 [Clydaea vesicula]
MSSTVDKQLELRKKLEEFKQKKLLEKNKKPTTTKTVRKPGPIKPTSKTAGVQQKIVTNKLDAQKSKVPLEKRIPTISSKTTKPVNTFNKKGTAEVFDVSKQTDKKKGKKWEVKDIETSPKKVLVLPNKDSFLSNIEEKENVEEDYNQYDDSDDGEDIIKNDIGENIFLDKPAPWVYKNQRKSKEKSEKFDNSVQKRDESSEDFFNFVNIRINVIKSRTLQDEVNAMNSEQGQQIHFMSDSSIQYSDEICQNSNSMAIHTVNKTDHLNFSDESSDGSDKSGFVIHEEFEEKGSVEYNFYKEENEKDSEELFQNAIELAEMGDEENSRKILLNLSCNEEINRRIDFWLTWYNIELKFNNLENCAKCLVQTDNLKKTHDDEQYIRSCIKHITLMLHKQNADSELVASSTEKDEQIDVVEVHDAEKKNDELNNFDVNEDPFNINKEQYDSSTKFLSNSAMQASTIFSNKISSFTIESDVESPLREAPEPSLLPGFSKEVIEYTEVSKQDSDLGTSKPNAETINDVVNLMNEMCIKNEENDESEEKLIKKVLDMRGSLTVLTPIKASKKERNMHGVKSVITPVRRSVRVLQQDDKLHGNKIDDVDIVEWGNEQQIEKLLEGNGYAYVPNKNIQLEKIKKVSVSGYTSPLKKRVNFDESRQSVDTDVTDVCDISEFTSNINPYSTNCEAESEIFSKNNNIPYRTQLTPFSKNNYFENNSFTPMPVTEKIGNRKKTPFTMNRFNDVLDYEDFEELSESGEHSNV